MTLPVEWAVVAFVSYFFICLWVGEVFPFSLYGMYSEAAGRNEGAAFIFLADGKAAPIEKYHSFSGIDPNGIYPQGIPCSLEWEIQEASRWIRDHSAVQPSKAGPIKVQIGYRLFSFDASGKLVRRLKIVADGAAWRL